MSDPVTNPLVNSTYNPYLLGGMNMNMNPLGYGYGNNLALA